MSTGAYNLYVNLQAQTGGLASGLRSGAAQLRQFDGQLQQTNRTLNETGTATQRLARLQASASADAVLGQQRVAAAAERTRAAQNAAGRAGERSARAQAVAANTAAAAERERAAAVAAGERTLRSQALAQSMAARAAATTGRGAAAAQNTANAAAAAATRAARAQALQEERAASLQAASARASQLAARASTARQAADAQALRQVTALTDAEAAAAQRAAANSGAVRRAQAAADAETRAATQARIDGYLRTGAVLGAVLGVGVMQAIDLEKRMANVLTISQDFTQATIGAATDQIVELSTEVTQSASDLADGLYQIVSSGFDGQAAMNILQVAAKGASAGLTTTEVSARALLGVLNAYGIPASKASDVMDVMFQTVNKGVVSFEELAQQLGDVVPMAAAAGVDFDDMSAAFAAITVSGIPAAESATALNMMLTRMMQPTQELTDAMHELGYESAASALEQDGLYVVVQKLTNATHGSAEEITSLFHDVRASRAALALAANDGENYADAYQAITFEVERAGATQKAFALQMDTTSGQWQMFVNRSKALGIDLGRALLPVVQALGNALSIFAGALQDAPGPLKDVGAGLLAITATGAITLALITKLTQQWTAFRLAQATARAGGSAMPAVLKGAGVAVSGLTGLLAIGVLAYTAYSASKQKAKQATDDLVEALQREREGESGAGVKALTEQLVSSDFADKMKAAGVDINDAIDAVLSGGTKLEALQVQLDARYAEYAQKVKAGKAPGNSDYTRKWDDAGDALDDARSRWSKALKKDAELANEMDIVNAKVAKAKAGLGDTFTLDALVPVGKDGLPAYTDEMKAMAQALGSIVDPAKAWQAAQDKVAKANKNAKASLSDYLKELKSQLKAQRSFQGNLSKLALAGYGGLTDHFSKLGVSSAPILDELVTQLSKGKTKVADELQDIMGESSARSKESFRAGLAQLPAIAAKYGKKIGKEFAKAAETNDAGKFAKVLQEMAVVDLSRAVKKSTGSAKKELERGMGLLAQVTAKKGKAAGDVLQQAFLSGDVTSAMDQLRVIWGAKLPISEADLRGVVGAFKKAGADSTTEWTAMLDLIETVSKTKGTAAAQALTSALLSGDMAAVQTQLDGIGASVRAIPGNKGITFTVDAPPSVTIPVYFRQMNNATGPRPWGLAKANGGIVDFYADGGIRREDHTAQIAPAGAWRVWAEDESGGEAYLPLAPSKRARSKQILDEVAHRFGASVDYHADGGLSGWSYEPLGSRELLSVSSIRSDSMRTVTTGKGKNKKETDVFSLSLFERNLDRAVAKAVKWRKDLATVARRAGQDVADALADMGEDGVELTHKMATGSSKYLSSMVKDLEKLGAVAKASLSDYTSQLKNVTKDTATFQANLVKLASSGYGALASRLADQGDEAAQQLAAQAVKSKKSAAAANTASKAAGATLSDDDLADLLTVIGAVKNSKTGLHDVAEATEMDEDRIIEVANAGLTQMKKALGSRATRFLADLTKANKGVAYENGGVLTPGLYATSNGLVRFAEPATQGEAFIPLGAAKRSQATQVLEDVARRFGYQLTASGVTGPMPVVAAQPSQAVQVVVVRDERPSALVGSMPITVNGGASKDAAQTVATAINRKLRNAQRGGRI
ncbi:phage tail tape measure protein [Streptomyces sp. NPDC002795]|uniref:phage tail tape measure protein n=1 Tax=Streptomyces sp. NPDC002795 TaxID=3364665 RepID=UPI0036ADBEDF